MIAAFICDAVRTPIGRYGGALSPVRPDDLAAHILRELQQRQPRMDWSALDEVYFGCANQSGEDNRNVARMATLLSGLPQSVPAVTLNRLCASGMEAVGEAARAIACGELACVIAGGVESMSRSPFVIGKAEAPFQREAKIYDTTLGWRFVNPKMETQYGVDTMAETADNVAAKYRISREDQDAFAMRSQYRAAQAQVAGFFSAEVVSVPARGKKSEVVVDRDEHPRNTTLDALQKLKPINPNGSATAGNSSGINDGAAAMIVCSEAAAVRHGLRPRARVIGMASAAVEPRLMGIGPVPATQKLLARLGKKMDEFKVIELNEAFASQVLACLRQFGLSDDASHVNANGGAIALGHPLGMSGARLVLTAVHRMEVEKEHFALASMCVGVGQGVAIALERV
jgi:3-oxoadipyl-CoA thiolase